MSKENETAKDITLAQTIGVVLVLIGALIVIGLYLHWVATVFLQGKIVHGIGALAVFSVILGFFLVNTGD